MTLNRLLDQFKGVLIDRCKGGKGTNYDRLSEHLAANSPLTKSAVLDGQRVYDDLSKELMEIRKSMRISSGDRIVEILREIEDHIIIITDALDSQNWNIIHIAFLYSKCPDGISIFSRANGFSINSNNMIHDLTLQMQNTA